MTLCTSGVFSTARRRSASRSMPHSAQAALPSSSRRFLNTGSAQACAMTREPRCGNSWSKSSMRRRTCSAVMTPFSSSSSCIARLMISCSEGAPSSCDSSCAWLCGIEPMLIQLQFEEIMGRTLVARPDVALLEAHAVEDALGFAIEAVGELLGVRESAADALHGAALASYVGGRAPVARGSAAFYRYSITHVEAPLRRGRVGASACGFHRSCA